MCVCDSNDVVYTDLFQAHRAMRMFCRLELSLGKCLCVCVCVCAVAMMLSTQTCSKHIVLCGCFVDLSYLYIFLYLGVDVAECVGFDVCGSNDVVYTDLFQAHSAMRMFCRLELSLLLLVVVVDRQR